MEGEPTQTERVGPNLWRVPLRTPTLPPATRTNTFVLTLSGGAWVVDPGSPHRRELKRLDALLDELTGHVPLAGYVVTHYHRDHWGGLSRLLQRRPAPVICLEPGNLGRLRADFRTVGWFDTQTPAGYQLAHMPGHASDHVVVITPERDVLAGDLVAGVGTVVIDPPDGDMAAYLDSLERLLALAPDRLFPAHGPTVNDGCAKLREYLDHRREREAQVIDALDRLGPATPGALVPPIYPDIPIWLRPVAARSVLAHLIKLEAEGRARQAGARWERSNPRRA